jgi:hypothetical protein
MKPTAPNEVLHADGANLGDTSLSATFGDRAVGAGAAGEHYGVRRENQTEQ